MLYACDNSWWKKHFESVRKHCTGEFWTINQHCAKTMGLNYIESEQGGGLSKNPGVIRQGGNSGFQAVQLAIMFGAAKIILLGYDMQPTGGRSHWHGDHQGLSNPERRRFASWQGRFAQLSRELTGVEIVNASRETGLDCFQRLKLDESLGWSSAGTSLSA